ncbi:hypothetical protein [Vibrio metschnikovii]
MTIYRNHITAQTIEHAITQLDNPLLVLSNQDRVRHLPRGVCPSYYNA